MLEVTNTGPEPEEIEMKLFGDGQLVDITKLRLKPGERLPRFYPNLSGASRTLEARIAPIGQSKDELPSDDRAYALLPERRRAKVLVVTSGNTYLEAALLLDEYLDVSLMSPRDYLTKGESSKAEVIVFDGVTPASPPRANAIYLDPRGPGSPVKVDVEIKAPGFDKIERKHPIVRWTALDDVNIARGHKLVPEPNDKVIGASDQGAILVTGARGGFRFVALGFDVRESDLPLRVAWPLLLLNSINFFLEETAGYISSFRTGDVFRIPLVTEAPRAELTLPGNDGKPGKKELVPMFEGRAVYLGQNAGIYELLASDAKPGAEGASSGKTAFAANLLDREESTLTAVPELTVDGKKATSVEGFTIGVRREIWIYLLIAAVILTAIEWATYHRRVTV